MNRGTEEQMSRGTDEGMKKECGKVEFE